MIDSKLGHSFELYRAISEIAYKSCLKFEKLQNNEFNINKTGLYFRSGQESDNLFGRRLKTNYYQNITINIKNATPLNFIRWILYALGIDFKHNRPDADDYIIIHRKNINDSFLKHVKQKTRKFVNTYGLKYDFESVMALNEFEYAKNNKKKTFEVIDFKNKKKNITNHFLSQTDILILNKYYCEDKCNPMYQCLNKGVPDYDSCNKCICQFTHTGRYCQHPTYLRTKYCQDLDLKADKNYKEFTLDLSSNCSISITSSPETSIMIEYTFFGNNQGNEYTCNTKTGYIEIRYERNKYHEGLILCSYIINGGFLTEDNYGLLFFRGIKSGQHVKIKYKEISSDKIIPPSADRTKK